MRTIRLVRHVRRPAGSGPTNGQYTLQKFLRTIAPNWLRIGGNPSPGEIPWFWSWQDIREAKSRAENDESFLAGPNVLFLQSRFPATSYGERQILDARSCRMLFTESRWYARLIESMRGPWNAAPMVVWPYPIDPMPPWPEEKPRWDLLIYLKRMELKDIALQLMEMFPNYRLVRYGRYSREELGTMASQSGCCFYLSVDDRGPLALAEILCAGCPTIGIERGAPFIRHGHTGYRLPVRARTTPDQMISTERLWFQPRAWREAVDACRSLDRHAIALSARRDFDPHTIAAWILENLKMTARD